MTDAALNETIRRFILETFLFSDDLSALKDDASLLDLGVIDSTGVLELVLFLEETFELTVLDDELVPENLDSVERIADFVVRKRQAAPAGQG
jgi:acyl carrier protein